MAHCPNINLKEWKDLVETVGEVEAYSAYIKNGYEIPVLDAEDEYVIKDEKINEINLHDIDQDSDFLKRITKVRSEILTSLKTKYKIYEGSKKTEEVQQLKKLIEEFEKADMVRSLIIFTKNVDSQITALNNRMTKGNKSLAFLKQLNDFAGTFYMLDDVVKLLQTNDIVPTKQKEKYASILGKVKSFEKKYLQYSKEIMVENMANQSTIARAKAKIKYAKEYEENNPRANGSKSKEEHRIAKKEYVRNQLNVNAKKILADEKRYVREILNTAPQDISAFTKMMIDPKGVNDHLIQLAVKVLGKADFNAKEDFISARNDALKVFEPFMKSRQSTFKTTDQKKLYENIIEKIDGKETNYYVREFLSTYYTALNEAHRAKVNTSDPAEVRRIDEEFKKNFPKSKMKNPQFNLLKKDPEKQALYDYLLQFNMESDNNVAKSGKLGYKLPSITKTLGETKTDVGYKETVKRAGQDLLRVQRDDTQFGELKDGKDGLEVATDERGNALRRVAVQFRMPIDIKDQSFDLMGMALTNRFVSLNYKYKNAARVELEVLEDLMKDRKFNRKKSGHKLFRKLGISEEEQQELQGEGVESQSYKLMHDILEDRLYGRHNIKAGKLGLIDLDKVADFSVKWSANNMLIMNYMGGGANVLAGKVMNFFEGTRKVHYSRSDLRTAELKYWKDVKGWGKDIGKVGQPVSKTNMLIEKFIDTSMDFSGMSNVLSHDNKFKNLFKVSTLHSINTSAEHYIQSTLVYAMLNNTKVTNKNGEFIGKDGKVTSDRKEAMSMDQAYDKEGGKLVWRNKDWTIEGHNNFDGDVEFVISSKIKDIVADLQGNYDPANRAMIQRHWYGKLTFFLRKWMVRGVQRRFRGVGKKGEFEDVAFYSEAQQEFKEGTYTSSIRYLTNVWKEGKLIQAAVYSKQWDQISDVERGNIVSAAYEVALAATMLAAGTFLAALAEGADSDEEEEVLYSLAYLARRQYGELLFYVPIFNPMEAIRVAKSPSAVLSTLEQATKTIQQLIEDGTNGEFEVNQSGKNVGRKKTVVNLEKLGNPIGRNFTPSAEAKYKYLLNPPI